jgi:hypothetical protein
VSVILELLRGADLDTLSRRHGVTAAKISEWRDAFLAGGEAHLKSRDVVVDDEETRRLKNVVADLATEKRSPQKEDSPLGGQRPFGLVEVEAMSRQTSPSTHQRYGVVRVLRVWKLPRSTFYAQRRRRAQPATGRRGRTPVLDDPALLVQIRAVIAESPSHGEGHRKVWARLRALKAVRTSMRRVLRVMREAALLAPARHPAPVVERPHDDTIVTDRPNVMCGTDATTAFTMLEGPATIFAAIDHCTAECVGIHARATAIASKPSNRCGKASAITSVASGPRSRTDSRAATTTAASISALTFRRRSRFSA